jgi:DNA polymerase III gamma/tau subunit
MKFKFNNIIGNTSQLMLIRRSISRNSFSNFTILCGLPGTGKTSTAITSALALTCENPENGEPCLECKSCKNILKALDTTWRTNNFVKVNIPELVSRSEFKELINDIFVLQNGVERCVYILEEMHAIKDEGVQQALLAHIDSMPSNVYIIATTTELNKLIQPIRSRARIFRYSRLTKDESSLLLDMLSKDKNVILAHDLQTEIIENSQGIPRQISSLFDFVLDNEITLEELKDYFKEIKTYEFIELFAALKSDSLASAVELLDSMLERVDSYSFLKALKKFYLDVFYLIDGNILGEFTMEDGKLLSEIFKGCVPKVFSIIDSISSKASPDDLRFSMMKIRQVLHNDNLNDAILKNNRYASEQNEKTKQLVSQHDIIKNIGKTSVETVSKNSFEAVKNKFKPNNSLASKLNSVKTSVSGTIQDSSEPFDDIKSETSIDLDTLDFSVPELDDKLDNLGFDNLSGMSAFDGGGSDEGSGSENS